MVIGLTIITVPPALFNRDGTQVLLLDAGKMTVVDSSSSITVSSFEPDFIAEDAKDTPGEAKGDVSVTSESKVDLKTGRKQTGTTLGEYREYLKSFDSVTNIVLLATLAALWTASERASGKSSANAHIPYSCTGLSLQS